MARGGKRDYRGAAYTLRRRRALARRPGRRYPRYAGQGPVISRRGRHAIAMGELKFHDVTLDDAIVAAGGAITNSINLIAVGTTESERIGRKIVLKSIMFRYEWSMPFAQDQADPPSGDVCRFVIYQDRQANGATAAVTDIFESADYQSFNNLSNSGRFTILVDRTIDIDHMFAQPDGASTGAYATVNRAGTVFKKVNIPLEFSAATGAITEIRSNNIGVCLFTKNGVAGFASQVRLRFSDN